MNIRFETISARPVASRSETRIGPKLVREGDKVETSADAGFIRRLGSALRTVFDVGMAIAFIVVTALGLVFAGLILLGVI